MAKIISETKKQQVHKEHKCFEKNSFLKGFYSFSNYCPECGESLLEEKEVTSHRCSECGEIFIIKTKYCPNCGEKFDNEPISQNLEDAFNKPSDYLIETAIKDPGAAIATFQLARRFLRNIGIKV